MAEIVARGYAADTVERVQRLLYAAEYKRRQAPPGVKIGGATSGATAATRFNNAFREPL